MCAAEDAAKDERFQRKQMPDFWAKGESWGKQRNVENVTVRSVGEPPTARWKNWLRGQIGLVSTVQAKSGLPLSRIKCGLEWKMHLQPRGTGKRSKNRLDSMTGHAKSTVQVNCAGRFRQRCCAASLPVQTASLVKLAHF